MPSWRHWPSALLLLALTGCSSSRIAWLPSATPPGCPYAPAGHSSWVRVTVVNTAGDTLSGAHVAIAPVERDSAYWISAEQRGNGYGFGPLRAARYILRVEHAGYISARRTVTFCKDQEAFFLARLKPGAG